MFGDQCCYDTFQSTPPIRVATWPSKNVQVFLRISIHATHTGGDMVSCGWWKRINHFNPRHPYGWRPGLSAFRTNGRLFQSTPPMLTASPKGFQSTPPIRVATSNVVFKPCERLFQSTPPIRVATMGLLIRFKGGGFQSTPPIRVATFFCFLAILLYLISIHATHTGGDAAVPQVLQDRQISIHATHTGGDPTGRRSPSPMRYFNPRHPYGWRQGLIGAGGHFPIFQSTPPIRVATSDFSVVPLMILFQSTPPIRVATGPSSSARLTQGFQSTPPIRVATSLHRPGCRLCQYFNPRHPYGWRPVRYCQVMAVALISIHATHTGGDPVDQFGCIPRRDFNPRHPYGWRHGPLALALR
mgnify:CR=1 FL=1